MMQEGCGMKQKFVLLLIFFLVSCGNTQEIINNSDKPISKNSGRTVSMEEVLHITDDGKTLIFRAPKLLRTLDDGSLVFLDSSFLYKFSRDGQFIFKILKRGEGPGECTMAGNFIIQADKIRVLAGVPRKVLDYDLEGKYIQETKAKKHISGFDFLEVIDGEIYGIRAEMDMIKEGIGESPFRLYKISNDFENWTKLYDFPIRHFFKDHRWIRLERFDAVGCKEFLFVVFSAEYRIVKFNLNNSQVERIFSREYIRQKISKEVEEEVNRLNIPDFKYNYDIFGLHIFADSLWVITSTISEDETRFLVDVFDMEGKYTDSFYLQFPKKNTEYQLRKALFSEDGHIYIPEQNQETGFMSIGKYRLIDSD
jgi:hypothetical protein